MNTTENDADFWSTHKYTAFISYSRADAELGGRFQRDLEKYRIPKPLIARNTLHGPVPKRLIPIFRDITDMSATGDLGEQINNVLEDSAFLILLCSPRSASSKWVNAEIEHFKRLGRRDRIIAVLIDGEPVEHHPVNAPDGAFPPALMRKIGADGQLTDQPEPEPIAPDLRSHAEGYDYGVLKTVAAMIGLAPDILSQRRAEMERRERRAIRRVAMTVSVLAIAATTAAVAAYNQMVDARVSKSRAFASLAWNAIDEGQFDRATRYVLQAVPAGQGLVLATSTSDADEALQSALWQDRTLARIQASTRGDGYQIAHIEFSGNGERAAVVGSVGGIRIVDLNDGALLMSVPGVGRIQETDYLAVFSAALNHDGTRLMTFGLDPNQDMFDPERCDVDMEYESDAFYDSPWYTSKGTIWDVDSGCPIGRLDPDSEYYGAVPGGFVWSPDGARIIATSWFNRQSTIYRTQPVEELFTIVADPEERTNSVEGFSQPLPLFTADGAAILAKSARMKVSLLEAETGREIRAFVPPDTFIEATDEAEYPSNFVNSVAFVDEASKIEIGYNDGRTLLFDTATAEVVASPDRIVVQQRYVEDEDGYGGHVAIQAFRAEDVETPLWSVPARVFATIPGGQHVAVFSGLDAQIRDLVTGEIHSVFSGHSTAISAGIAHPTRPLLLTGSQDGEIRLWDMSPQVPQPSNEIIGSFMERTAAGMAVLDVDKLGYTFRAADLEQKGQVTFEAPVDAYAFRANGDELVIRFDDASTAWINTIDGSPIAQFQDISALGVMARNNQAPRIAFQNGSRQIVVGERETGAQTIIAPDQTHWRQVAISNDGTLAIGLHSGLIAAYDIETGAEVWRFEGFIDTSYFETIIEGEKVYPDPRLGADDMLVSPGGGHLFVKHDNRPRVESQADQGFILDIQNGSVVQRLAFDLYENMWFARYTHDGSKLVSTSYKDSDPAEIFLKVWDAKSGELIATISDFPLQSSFWSGGNDLLFALSDSGDRILTQFNGNFDLWSTRSGRKIASLSEAFAGIDEIDSVMLQDGFAFVRAKSGELWKVVTPAEQGGRVLAAQACERVKRAGLEAYSIAELAAVDLTANQQVPCSRAGLLSPQYYLSLFNSQSD